MLSYMRKHSKGWMIKIIFGAIILTFVAWGGSSYMAREGSKVAKIDKHIISDQVYRKAYDNTIEAYRQQYGNFFNEEMIKMLDLKNKVLDQLINNYIIELEAKKMGIRITTEDLQESIKKLPVFMTNGSFDMAKYNQLLGYLKVTPSEFEDQQRNEMIRQRLMGIVSDNVYISKKEIEAAYYQKEDVLDLNFICFNPDQFRSGVKVDEATIKAWYESHKESYKVPPKTKISFIMFDAAKYAQSVIISDKDKKDYYNDHLSEYTIPAKVHGRQIIITVPMKANEKIKKEKEKDAQKIADEAKKGTDFAGLAKKFSQDPVTSKNGGDLGMVEKDKLPDGLGDTLLSMKPGEIKGPLRTRMGFRIVKLDAKVDEKARPFEEVASVITEKLTARAARDKSYTESQNAFSTIFEDPKADITAFAKKKGLELKEFGPFAENEQIAIPMGTKVTKDAASRQEGDLGDVIDTGTGYMVYKVTGRINARIPELNEVRERVISDASKEKANEAAKAYANQLLAKGASALNAMPHETTGTFKRSEGVIPKLGGDAKLKDDLDSLNIPKSYLVEDRSCVVWLNLYAKADPSGITPAKTFIIKSDLLKKKKDAVFEDFIKSAKKKHKIEIVQDKLK
jgi:peptidyl-prolyl cis-trans isomerase D